MTEYPQLNKMGVKHPNEIEKYMINGISNYDVLRIVYSREKSSLLPSSRTYKFLRIPRELPATGSKETTTVLETNPELKVAISELEQLLDNNVVRQSHKKELLEQIRLLEEDIALRSKYIRELADQL